MMIWLCVAPSVVLMLSGLLIAAVSRRDTMHAIGGAVTAGAGALGLESIASGWIPLHVLFWPLLAFAMLALWLLLVPHKSPRLQRWSVTDRGALGD